MQKTLLLVASLWLSLLSFGLLATAVSTGYREPVADITAIVDAAPTPSASLSPDGSTLLSLQFPALPSLADLAAPQHRLAGVRINPANNGPSQPRYIAGVTLIDIATGNSREIKDLPENLKVISAEWSPDSRYVAVVQLEENASSLWRIDTKDATAKRWGKLQPNAVQGAQLEWAASSDAMYLLAVDPKRPAAPVAAKVPAGPVVTEARGRTAPARTYQDLLKDSHDEALFSHYFTSQLVKISLSNKVTQIGKPALIRRFSLSPDNQHLLVTRIVPPFSYAVPIYRFATNIEVWNARGEVSYTVAEQPVADNLPIAFDAVETGPRRVSWRADAPATLHWAQAADGGDPANEAEVRDQLWQLAAPFSAEPVKLLDMAFRFRDLLAADANTALVYEGWWQERQEKVWLISPDGSSAPKLLWQRSTEDRYADPGRPLMTTADNGQRLLRLENGHMYLTAVGASEQGNRPFIDKYELASGDTERLWRSEAPYYEYPITLLPGDKLLTQREAPTEPADFYLRDLQSGKLTALTDTPHPMPHTLGISRELINYQRADGVPMSANLILPADYKPKRDGPLPTVIWAYPREFRNAAAAGQVSDSPYRFNRISYWTPQFLATQGYAVLDNATMPIVGEGETEPNDNFIAQLVLNAEAAIGAGVSRGVTDPQRVAIGGHSYGAFMTANLLAHTNLFKAGIARSGAYNRSLTPFGFQREQRTLWDDPDLYLAMSPFFHADKLKTPLLMIHGTDDNNSGTFPMQSERLYQAVKGHGGTTRLVMLPLESHGYRARESVLHMLWETQQWLDEFVKNAEPAKAP
ncbi:MAG: S9 family peptidase [Rheinheimera sp.]|uniref:alpha/beta hydrolase family protein n=1 Tax=Arsukibacterium sp. UBA3155 TaxID=1946058 RepID=UPI000C8C4B3E|nr:prolyl oligopeptidase family serine peptidase [Arsukibacterium sp. UBA3155]MAD73215.1 S9 family peptidase [Rheinheimera sp.]|tara:strand:- start:42086 stop:44512 length:2427 start_codon:yes stop_codon:yes gene_type:complete